MAPEDEYPDQGTQYAAFLDGELKRENDRRSSLLTRAGTAVTASTGLVTLVLALFTVVIGKDPTITGAAKWGVTVAVVFLLGSAACALEAGRPRKNREQTAISTLQSLIDDENWTVSEVNARWQTANITIDQIDRLRSGSKGRGRWLRAAGICQVLAVAALAFSTVFVVSDSPGQNHSGVPNGHLAPPSAPPRR